MSAGFLGWVNFTISCELTAQNYRLTVWSSGVVRKFYSAGTTNQILYNSGGSYPSYPNPLTAGGYLSEAHSIYVTYTPAGGGQNIIEVLQETCSASEASTDQKEKLVSYGESSSTQSETITQKEGTVTLIETISELIKTTSALYIITDAVIFSDAELALAFALLAFVIAIAALSIMLLSRKGRE